MNHFGPPFMLVLSRDPKDLKTIYPGIRGSEMFATIGKRHKGGFTLIELMVVIAIIGIIAAIDVPQFSAYRQRAYIAALKSDGHSFANAQEACYTDNDTYCSTSTMLVQATYGARKSDNTTVAITSADAVSYTMTFTDTLHGGIVVTYRSAAGGLQ